MHLLTAVAGIDAVWSPHIAATVNGEDVRIARIDGEFDWHRHDAADEAFFVLRGEMQISLRDGCGERSVKLADGDLFVVPKGIEHRPSAHAECWLMIITTSGALNTGNIRSERTRETLPRVAV